MLRAVDHGRLLPHPGRQPRPELRRLFHRGHRTAVAAGGLQLAQHPAADGGRDGGDAAGAGVYQRSAGRSQETGVGRAAKHEHPRDRIEWLHRQEPGRLAGAAARRAACWSSTRSNTPQELDARAGAGRSRLSPGRRQPAAVGGRISHGQRRSDGSVCDRLLAQGRATPIVLSSSIQAELDNPYGVSKRQAEEVVAATPRPAAPPCDLPPEERLRQVVPPQLQLGRGHLLPQYCPRSADHDLRPGAGAGAGACG